MNKLIKFKAKFVAGEVDRKKNIIHGMTLIQANREALGHELFIDEKFVRSVVKQGKETGDIGLKARFDHPSACFSSMGSQIGRFKNFSMRGDKAVADLHLAPFAFNSNPNGNLGEFLMDAAENDPDIMGNSIVFSMAEAQTFKAGEDDDADSPEFIYPHARLNSLLGCDVVDEGAATDGMFSIHGRPDYLAEQAQHWLTDKSDLVKTILKPLLKEMVTELNNNTNKNKSIMSDEKKSFLTKLTELISSESSEANEDTQTEALEVNEDLEAENTELAAKDVEIAELKAGIEVSKTESEEAQAKFDKEVKENKDALLEIKADFEAFKNEPIGGVVEPTANTSTSVEPSKETKEAQKELNKDEQMAEWAFAEQNGDTVAKTFIKDK